MEGWFGMLKFYLLFFYIFICRVHWALKKNIYMKIYAFLGMTQNKANFVTPNNCINNALISMENH